MIIGEKTLGNARSMPKTNQELFEIVEAARANNDFAGSLNELSFDDLRRVDKYLDSVMGAHAEGTRDHNLWKQVRDEIAIRLVDKADQVGDLAINIGPKSEKLIGVMREHTHRRVEDLLRDLDVQMAA